MPTSPRTPPFSPVWEAFPADVLLELFASRLLLPRDAIRAAGEGAYLLAWGVAGVTQLSTLTALRDSLSEIIREGGTLEDWRDSLGEILESTGWGTTAWHAETIFRTTLASVMESARYLEITGSRFVDYLVFDAINDDRVRDEHLALDGFYWKKEEFPPEYWPPLGFNCRCSVIPADADELDDLGAREAHGTIVDEDGVPIRADEGFRNAPSVAGLSEDLRQSLLERLAAAGWESVPLPIVPPVPPLPPTIPPDQAPILPAPPAPTPKTPKAKGPKKAKPGASPAVPGPAPTTYPLRDFWGIDATVPLEGTAEARILAVEEQIKAHKAYEVGAAVDARTGEVVFAKRGDRTSIEVASELRRMLLRNTIFTHSHPSGQSLSSADVAVSILGDLAQIRAVGTFHTGQAYGYVMRRPEGGWKAKTGETGAPLIELMLEKFRTESTNLEARWLGRIVAGKLRESIAEEHHFHVVWAKVAHALGWTYTRRKIGGRGAASMIEGDVVTADEKPKVEGIDDREHDEIARTYRNAKRDAEQRRKPAEKPAPKKR